MQSATGARNPSGLHRLLRSTVKAKAVPVGGVHTLSLVCASGSVHVSRTPSPIRSDLCPVRTL
eukprot:1097203-Prymnesium_polylepis.1